MLNIKLQSNLNWVLTANLATGLVNFSAGIWFARALGPLTMGGYAVVTTAVFLTTGMFSMGFDQAIIRFPDRSDVESAAVLATHAQAVGMALISLAAYGIYMYQEPTTAASLAGPAVGVISAVLIGLYANLMAAPIAAQLDYRQLSLVRLLSVFSGVVVGLYLLWTGFGIYSLVCRDLITAAVFLALLIRRSPIRWVFVVNREGLACLARFNGALWGLNLMERLVLRLDYAMVGLLFGKEALGVYFAIRSIMEGAVGFLIQPMQTVLFAHHCRDLDVERTRKTLIGASPLLYGIGVVVLVPLIYLLAPWVVRVAFGDRYLDAVPLVPGFVLYAGAIVWFEYIKVASMAWNAHHSMLLARVVQLMVYLPLVIILGRSFGFFGAALAMGSAAWMLALTASFRLWRNLRDVEQSSE